MIFQGALMHLNLFQALGTSNVQIEIELYEMAKWKVFLYKSTESSIRSNARQKQEKKKKNWKC